MKTNNTLKGALINNNTIKKHAKIWQTASPGLVALYDIRPGNESGQFLQSRSLHGAVSCKTNKIELGVSSPCLARSSVTALRMLHFMCWGGMQLCPVEVENLSWLLTNVLMSLWGALGADDDDVEDDDVDTAADLGVTAQSRPFILAAIFSDSSTTDSHTYISNNT